MYDNAPFYSHIQMYGDIDLQPSNVKTTPAFLEAKKNVDKSNDTLEKINSEIKEKSLTIQKLYTLYVINKQKLISHDEWNTIDLSNPMLDNTIVNDLQLTNNFLNSNIEELKKTNDIYKKQISNLKQEIDTLLISISNTKIEKLQYQEQLIKEQDKHIKKMITNPALIKSGEEIMHEYWYANL